MKKILIALCLSGALSAALAAPAVHTNAKPGEAEGKSPTPSAVAAGSAKASPADDGPGAGGMQPMAEPDSARAAPASK